jgi:hypothetical protein
MIPAEQKECRHVAKSLSKPGLNVMCSLREERPDESFCGFALYREGTCLKAQNEIIAKLRNRSMQIAGLVMSRWKAILVAWDVCFRDALNNAANKLPPPLKSATKHKKTLEIRCTPLKYLIVRLAFIYVLVDPHS